MEDDNIKRISRLTAIATQLQTKRVITATELSEKFDVSVRTIYRDIRALEEAGIPIITKEGRGYTLMEGYRIPPVMFTEHEANALITTNHLLSKNKDISLSKAFATAIDKVRAALKYSTKEKTELLADRIALSPIGTKPNSSDSLMLTQNALTSFRVLEISYGSNQSDEITTRQIEPFAMYYSLEENWLLIAYCRLRQDFRMFRLDRIQEIKLLDTNFEPHKLSLAEYLAHKQKNFTTPDTPLS